MKKEDWLFVGYYTPDKNYPALAQRMQASVMAQGFECQIFERPSIVCKEEPPMPWVLNCAQCAEFCLEAFDRFPDRHIFYLDADAEMIRFPVLLLSPDLPEFDVAAPILNNDFRTNQLVSNSLIFRRTENARKVLTAWVEEQKKRCGKMLAGWYNSPYKEVWDQKVLQDVLEQSEVLFLELPWEYAKIAPKRGHEIMPNVDPEKVVILQKQVSRVNRRKVQNLGGDSGSP